MRRRLGWLALAGLLSASWVLPDEVRAQAIPLGPQFEVANTAPDTAYCDVSGAGDGFVVVWQHEDGSGVFGRRFDTDETPLGPAFPVDTDSADSFVRPGVAGNADGSFAVVWQANLPMGDDNEILARHFDAGGTPGSEFMVNTETGEAQRNPSVAAGGSGGFVVVWDSYNQGHNNDDDDIFGQRFDAAGDPLGGEFAVNAHTTEQQDEPVVAAWPGGEFVVVWNAYDNYTYHEGAIGRRFASDGTPSGGEFVVDPTGYKTTVATHPSGFVVAFSNAYYGAAARPFDAAGAPLAPTIPAASGAASYPDVAADGAGRFLVVWQASGGDGDGTGIVARLFGFTGTPIGADFVVNTYTTGYQNLPAVGAAGNGDFVVTWTGQGPSGLGVFARRFVAPPNAPIGVTSNKLIVVDKMASSSEAKVAYVSKDQTAGITKGAGTNVGAISATFSFAYDSVGGAFTLPAGESDGTQGWQVNSATVAKFVNTNAPSGVTGVKVAVIKPGKLLRIVGKSLGDTPIDLFAGPPTGSIVTEYAVTNGGDTFRHCSEFVSSDWKEIAGGTGRKLVAKNGTPAACP